MLDIGQEEELIAEDAGQAEGLNSEERSTESCPAQLSRGRPDSVVLHLCSSERIEVGDEATHGNGHDHDQICSYEDRVAHVGRHPSRHVSAPGQGIQLKVLHDAVKSDGQAGDDDHGEETFQLPP